MSIQAIGHNRNLEVRPASEDKIREYSNHIEGYFLKFLIDEMWSSVESLGQGYALERGLCQDMLNQELALQISANIDLKIGESIYQQLTAAYGKNLQPDQEDTNGEGKSGEAQQLPG